MKVAESDIYGQNWAACQVTAISLRCAGLNMANAEDDFDATEAEVKGQLLLLIDIIVCATFLNPTISVLWLCTADDGYPSDIRTILFFHHYVWELKKDS